MIAVLHHPKERQNHRDHNTFLDTNEHDNRRRQQSESIFGRAFTPNITEAAEFNQLQSNNKYNSAQDTVGKIFEWLGQEEQNQSDHSRRGHLRELALPARAFN